MKSSVSGKLFAFTGILRKVSRSVARGLVERAGGTCDYSMTPDVDYLVVGEAPGSKLARAQAIGVPTINEDEFLQMVGANLSDVALMEVDEWKASQEAPDVEKLREQLEKVTLERDEARASVEKLGKRAKRFVYASKVHHHQRNMAVERAEKAEKERDEAISRAEKAEADRDHWKRRADRSDGWCGEVMRRLATAAGLDWDEYDECSIEDMEAGIAENCKSLVEDENRERVRVERRNRELVDLVAQAGRERDNWKSLYEDVLHDLRETRTERDNLKAEAAELEKALVGVLKVCTSVREILDGVSVSVPSNRGGDSRDS